MKFLSFRKLYLSFKYAFRGLKYIIKSQQSFRIHLVITCLVVALMIYLRVTLWESVALIVAIVMVLVLELINSTFEKMMDILKPRIHPYAEVIKDTMAATVLIASIAAAAIGLIVFVPYFIDLFTK